MAVSMPQQQIQLRQSNTSHPLIQEKVVYIESKESQERI